ncbi:IQ calmodulin-binding motif family protein, putative [Ichthyophthirius multifiliis]|uniref:IQ calmodulin-binding motif family protein, putative n=1 Tax=Ichthyophthirius multifiliis TaxID=5932 RepID=G0R365_ICHMU|nr:IQ calmodulin-binding motif family protein, putative [Ichthyophthirius multifiliis]EGR28088.1 IQ calmodulin-binding motif family protein, putative [Ichthyophthirius multifiliis]|eukprot:XP_004027433.1 IQ calmodulin-binding motif family protein, putative [Ichthyophthirius multifiliis]
MGTCNTYFQEKQEIDPYNVPQESQPIKLDNIEESQQKVIKIQAHVRGHQQRKQVEELKLKESEDIPPTEIATPFYGTFEPQKDIVLKVLQENPKFNWPARAEFKNLTRLAPYKIIKNEAIYKGQWKNSKRHGRGIQYWPDSSVYQGDWENDMANGQGRLIHSDGDYYQGSWVNDRAQGKGIFKHIDGQMYEGDWLEDKQNGFGKEIQHLFIYEGEFQNGFKHGKGKLTWKEDQSYYDGEFQNGIIQGTGTYYFKDGKKYQGYWVNGKMHGYGEMYYCNGKIYKGQFEQDVKHGQGEMRYPDGKVYIGEWKNNKQNGQGKVILADGRIGKGIFKDGKLIKDD